MLRTIPYLTKPGLPLFSGASVGNAQDFQKRVENSIMNWYTTRRISDFVEPDPNGSGTVARTRPTNVQRWMAHLLLTTTVNITTSDKSEGKFRADSTHFFNHELLKGKTGFGMMVGQLTVKQDSSI